MLVLTKMLQHMRGGLSGLWLVETRDHRLDPRMTAFTGDDDLGQAALHFADGGLMAVNQDRPTRSLDELQGAA